MSEISIKMRLLPESQQLDYPVVNMPGMSPLMRGDGPFNYVCSNCGVTILEAVEHRHWSGLAIKCGGCLALNTLPGRS